MWPVHGDVRGEAEHGAVGGGSTAKGGWCWRSFLWCPRGQLRRVPSAAESEERRKRECGGGLGVV